MSLTINITPEDVDNLVREAVMKSAFGKTIADAVNKTLSYNSPIDAEIKVLVTRIAADILDKNYKEQITTIVTKIIQERITPELMQTIVDAAVTKMERAVEDQY